MSSWKAHRLRLKGLGVIPVKAIYPEKADALPFLISSSSDGCIKVWDSQIMINGAHKAEDTPSCLCSVETKDRITAMAVSYPLSQTGRNSSKILTMMM